MYATISRRRPDPARLQEALQRGQAEYVPKLEAAPGFVAFTLVAGDDGVTTAVLLWEDRASAEAFRATRQAWSAVLEELGSRLESQTAGEVLRQVSRP